MGTLFINSSNNSLEKQPIAQTSMGKICIYVNNTIMANISSELAQFKADIEADGYNVSIYSWGDIMVLGLKNNLTLEYNSNGLVGAILIGNIPYGLYDGNSIGYYYPSYPSDLYLMDLDGLWTDVGEDQDFDTHANGTGDMYPEIYIGRINPYTISTGNATDLLKQYFQRNHAYRNGGLPRFNNSLMWIDDDWESYSHEWKSGMEYLYNNITLVNNSVENTDQTSLMNHLTSNYEFVHAFIHSDINLHYVKIPGPSYQNVYSNQIAALNTKALFYNLYCCYATKVDVSDNLATHYLFNSNYSLGVFGSSRSGGFLHNRYLYDPLNQGKSLGESFKAWWSNDIYEPAFPHGPSDLTVTGNLFLGDPTLTIRNASAASTTTTTTTNTTTNSTTTTNTTTTTNSTTNTNLSSTNSNSSTSTNSSAGTATSTTSTVDGFSLKIIGLSCMGVLTIILSKKRRIKKSIT
jgi:hypothetical protein